MNNFLSGTFAFLIAMTGLTHAQTTFQDVVHLKNGTVYRGKIMEQHADSTLKIEIAGGSVIAVSPAELSAIEFKVPYDPQILASASVGTTEEKPDHGYFNVTNIGLMPGTSYGYYTTSSSVGFTIETINGYRWNPWFLTGAGLGLDIIQVPMVQLFGDARYEILKKRATPFVYLDAGYGIPIAQANEDAYYNISYKGGFAWGTGVGMRFNFRNEGAFLISAGYKSEKRTETTSYQYDDSEIVSELSFKRLAIKVGLSF